ncbi:M28 family peptidase [Pedobacter sp. SYSU D00535]|uniref:M28 family peptidase n=1 Tax=Pedobacter sp. SYSU D00535 TaxID=2810308 RepID=UPI001A977A7A|nr:M28 family peptidase [Pedobacter sp. SYSU D00535]
MMKKVLLSLAFAGVALQGFTQDPRQYSTYIDTVDARKHLTILASDEFEGRRTGTRGAEKAANYLADQFKRIGLAAPVNGSYFQSVPIVKAQFEVEKFEVNNKSLKNYEDFYLPTTFADKTIEAKEIVFVGYGISEERFDELKGLDLTNKVVMFIRSGEPTKNGVSALTKTTTLSEWSRAYARKVQAIQAKNPALILAVVPEGAGFSTARAHRGEPMLILGKRMLSTNRAEVVEINSLTANLFLAKSGKTLQSLKEQIDNTGSPASRVVKADFKTRYEMEQEPVKAVNVLGYLEGSDLKDELVVISAHYDHVGLNPEGPDKVFNGADDDGSGTTAVIELAEAFAAAKKAGKGPRRSVLFLAVVGEEEGLLGSEHYASNPVFPLTNTVTNLNIDMIGRVDPAHKNKSDYVYLIGSDKLSSELHKISEAANTSFTKLDLDYKYNDPEDPERIYYRSDHYNFAKNRIPIVFYFNGVHEDYHQPGDEVSKINFPLLVKRAHLVFYTAWEVLNRDKRPVVDSNKK